MKLLVLRKLHKWVALFVGVQLVLWTVSGLVFAWTDHHEVRGHALVMVPPAQVLPAEQSLLDPDELLRRLTVESVHEVRLLAVAGEWLYRVATPDGIGLYAASDGTAVELDARRAAAVARSLYSGSGSLESVVHHPGPTLETRRSGPTWEVRFSDDTSTSLYVSADDGSLAAARGDKWRLFDFFWMLHTMDYVGRDNFNNPLVILAGSAACWIALTGLWLVIRLFRPAGGGR